MVQGITDDIDPDVDPGGVDPIGEAGAAAAAAGAASLCLACGAGVIGPFCAVCGQKNDDLRRSSFVLVKDFFTDTFGFDSRMWRTLGLMAASPGLVPSHYSHGKRSRYTPPVRLFLVVSFLFFLTLGMTNTLFVAIEVKERAPLPPQAEAALREESGAFVMIDDADLDCRLSVSTRFFVRPQDITVDQDLWRRCRESLATAAGKLESRVTAPSEEGESMSAEEAAVAAKGLNRFLESVTDAIENPRAFNASANEWLPRVMFLMTPALALIMGIFIRGRGALLFDHVVLSLYSHAVGFTLVGVAIIATQLGARYAGLIAMALFSVYFVLALKRAYRRGWVKTIYSAAMIGFLYLTILSIVVLSIIGGAIIGNAA
jgi:hypothetical protein